jgi:hypothetical protein
MGQDLQMSILLAAHMTIQNIKKLVKTCVVWSFATYLLGTWKNIEIPDAIDIAKDGIFGVT